MRATRALIYLDRFRENLRAAAGRIGKRRICVPVKADAYGHGALPLARTALAAGADSLAVALVQEGEELRRGGIGAPILLLSQAMPDELADLVHHMLSPLVSDETYIDALAGAAGAAGRELALHLKVDTGMGRAGCRPEEAAALAGRILSHKSLRLAGVATHLAVSDSTAPGDMAYTGDQLRRFGEVLRALRAAGIDPGIVHAANTGALLYHPDSWFDMVRPGIFLYGYQPEDPPDLPGLPVITPRPVMELHSSIAAVKPLRRGESVSYGRTWTAAEDTLVALVPAGYADGLRRDLSNNWYVGIRGGAYPIVGRICMDQCMVNLGWAGQGRAGQSRSEQGRAVSPGDDVVLFGDALGDAAGDAAVMAKKLGTIPYEITCGITRRVPRVYTDHPSGE
jgi:alanine racemase